ncbi:AraC-like DNA-binding protein [Paenibacillus turicensis]|uniref:AraC-like DNA-binding protein n=1 Tax=Paenibacillus turicensis TaxID=160487 RepID=A0ABS4FUY2_9BACL|nr:AraC family transcriptional regulator [Paenibacillus turicensis]MBP1906163.1 AraC-like DNA-binding protein [Paenibacillus turicensis]
MITLNMPLPDVSIDTHTFSIRHLQNHQSFQTIHTKPQQGEYSVPTSPSYEISYVLRGLTTCWIPNEAVILNQGDLLLVPSFHLNHTKKQSLFENPQFKDLQPELCEQIHLTFDATFIDIELARSSLPLLEDTKKPSVVHLNINEQMAVEELFFKILFETTTSQAGSMDMIRALLIELLIHIYRTQQQQLQASKERSNQHPLYSVINEITSYLNLYFYEQHTLDSLAQVFYVSPSHLSRVFKQITGYRFCDYLQNIRIREAKKLLRETNLPIHVISDLVGYTHTSNFNVCFKKISGYTPRYYRRGYKKL